MHPKMSQITREEVLVRKRLRYERAGKEYKGKIISELVELFGYPRWWRCTSHALVDAFTARFLS